MVSRKSKILTGVICFLALSFSALAQNNPYRIDDECYQGYLSLEKLVGQTFFDDVFGSYITICDKKSDQKAKTLGYVLNLRNAISFKDDNKVEAARLDLMRQAKDSGYMQYYSYAFTNTATYYFNTQRKDKTISLLEELNKESIANNDAYGRWSAVRYLGNIYFETHDYVTSRRLLLQALDIYQKSNDATVKAQSLCKLYTDLAWTYDFDSDSVALFLNKAATSQKVRIDTVRTNVSQAFLASLGRNWNNYYKIRSKIDLDDKDLLSVNQEGPQMLIILDEFMRGHYDQAQQKSEGLNETFNLRLLSALARKYGKNDLALFWYDRYVSKINQDIFAVNESLLAEMRTLLDNDKLNIELLEKTRALNKQRTLQLYLLIGALLIGAILMFFYAKSIIKARKRTEEALRLAEEASNMKTSFVQNMSHEIRTPLNAIVGFSQLLALPDGFISDEEKGQYANYITNNSDMLTMLIDDILDLADVDKGNYRVSFGNCKCNCICRHAMNTVECRVPQGVELAFETDAPDDFEIYSDEKRIQQVLINYLTNACKHTESGKITVGCSLKENPGKVTFYVSDTGTGIPPECADKIFQRYTKLNECKQGSGLGLNICMTIAEKLKGEACVDKKFGRASGSQEKGSRFLFVVPTKIKRAPYTGLI